MEKLTQTFDQVQTSMNAKVGWQDFNDLHERQGGVAGL